MQRSTDVQFNVAAKVSFLITELRLPTLSACSAPFNTLAALEIKTVLGHAYEKWDHLSGRNGLRGGFYIANHESV